MIQFKGRKLADSKIQLTPPGNNRFYETLAGGWASESLQIHRMDSDIYCQIEDVADIHDLQGKLERVNLKSNQNYYIRGENQALGMLVVRKVRAA